MPSGVFLCLRVGRCRGQAPEIAEAQEAASAELRSTRSYLNLIVNAAQAIPEGHVEQNEIRITTSTDEAGNAVVEIADTGAGMSADTVSCLFTPFFTTKPPGHGTGLGLSISQRIVTGFGGAITVKSELGKGSVFRVTLQASRDDAIAAARAPAAVPPAVRRGRILVVDDEVSMGKAVERTLKAEHDVTAVTSGLQALERIAADAPFDIILCDVMMPDMTGPELHARLIELSRDEAKRMIFLTGGAFTPAARAFLDDTSREVIEKPFDGDKLRATINDRIKKI